MSSPYGYSPPPYGQSFNPYAAPQAGMPGFGPPGYGQPLAPVAYRSHGTGLKWAYLGSLVGGILLLVIGGIVMGAQEEEVGAVLLIVGLLAMVFGRLVVAMIWLFKAWDAVPADYRVTSSGKRVSPGEAVGYLFIPFFNLYWMFVASGGLADALDFLSRSNGVHKSAGKATALIACVTQFVPYANMLIAPFAWFAFMVQVDGAAQEIERASAGAAAGPVGFGPAAAFGPPAGGFGAPVAGHGPPPGGYGGPPPGGYGY